MLQIASGKFFKTSDEFKTTHRGTFYTNYLTVGHGALETSVGSLYMAIGFNGLGSFNHEVLERIEGTIEEGVMISTGGTELVEDFATVISFILNIICHPDPDLVRRLTGPTEDEHKRRTRPRSYLSRVFDLRLTPNPTDADILNRFITSLIGLKRRDYEAVIRAIRRYVTATHRIAEETDLAYSLFVMSVEALAQATEPPIASWLEYDEGKRRRVDAALRGVAADGASRVRAAILQNEHVAIARKFRAFTTDHLSPSFFRDEAVGVVRPIARPDLNVLLKRSYDLRSAYVHRLEGLPKILVPPFDLGETTLADDLPTLTFEGLARLARHVIFQFVERSAKVKKEDFHWRSALPNIVNMKLDSKYWICNPDGYEPKLARLWLHNFLLQISTTIANKQKPLPDLSKVLDKIEFLLSDTVKLEYRRPMLALYELFSRLFPRRERPLRVDLLRRFNKDFKSPSVEELSVYLVTETSTPWTLVEVDTLHETYFNQKYQKSHLAMGHLLEMVFTLRLAEWHREAGNEARTRALVVFAVEASPGHGGLQALEQDVRYGPLAPINAREILGLPTLSKSTDIT